MKRLISILIVLAMFITNITSIYAEEQPKSYSYGLGEYFVENNRLFCNKNGRTELMSEKHITEINIDESKGFMSILAYDNSIYQRYEVDLTNTDFIMREVQERASTSYNDDDEIFLFGSASENEAYIYDFLKNNMGLNTAAACGVIANLFCENSSFEPERRQGGGTGFGSYDDAVGYGICQWTYWSRKQNLQNWCNKNTGNGSWKTLYGQLMFMKHELESSSTLKKIKNVSNNAAGAYNAGYEFCMNYERPYYRNSPYKKNGTTYPSESDYRGILAKTTYWSKYSTGTSSSGEDMFAQKIEELKQIYVHGQYWNQYNSSDYSKTGTQKGDCSTSCAADCSCKCGKFYYNGVKYGGQCYGYAQKMGYLIFGTVPDISWTKHKDAYKVKAGDVVRIRNDRHSIFVIKVDGDDVYYTDCNNTGPCQVNWNGKTTKDKLASQLTYVLHNSNYDLTGGGSNTEISNKDVVTPSFNSTNKNDYPIPITCYTLKTGRITTYYGNDLKSGTGYIDGSNDQCVIKSIVSINGKDYAKVTYPGVKGYAYTPISSFINANISRYTAKTASNQKVYRRSDLSQSIGTVYSTDVITVVSESGNNVQIIYPVGSGQTFKMGWIKKSSISGKTNSNNSWTSGSVNNSFKTPLKTYPIATSNFDTYTSVNGKWTGYICPNDYCTIQEVYTNGWCKVTYPGAGGKQRTAYTKFNNFTTGGSFILGTTSTSSNQTVYTKSNLSTKLGTVYSSDTLQIVSSNNGKLQVIYPLDGGGYKMGWISESKTKSKPKSITVDSVPAQTTYVENQKLNTSGLGAFVTSLAGTIKRVAQNWWIFEEGETGYELHNTTFTEIGTNTVVVSYEEDGVLVTDSFNVEVVPREIVSLAVTKLPNKTSYIEQEKFDPSGLQVTATYNDDTSEILTNYEIDKPDMSCGTQKVNIFANALSTSFDITVKEKSLESIKLKTLPNKTTYAEGQSLDSTGLKLIASYNNGTTEEITSGFTCSAINSSYIGKQNVTVTYKGKTTTFPITFIEKKPSGIEIVSNPTKTDVLEGIIDLNTTGMKVKVSYDNGSSETIETGFNLVGYEPRTLGKQTITANYCGFTDTFDINVKAKSLTELKIAEPASVTEFIEGQDFASYGLVVHGYYDNGDINEISDYTISGYDNTVGTKTITIAYGGKTASYNVVVAQKELECIDIESLPTKTEYLEDDELDTTGLSVVAVYNNGDREAIALNDLTITGYDNTPGTKGINVSYGDFSTVFDVTVKEMTLTSFTLDTKPTKTEYNVGEELDLAGLSMTAKYEHGRIETVDINDCTISGFDKDKAGIQVVVISYRGSNVAFVVNVKQIVEQTAMIRTKNVSAVNGSTIAVPVNIINNTGISNLELNVSYDKNVLTNADIKASELLDNGTFNVTVSEETEDFITQTITWSADSDMAKNGTIFTAYFTVSGDAVAGNYPIEVTYNAETTKNKEGKAVKLSCVDGSVDVAEGETIPYVISGEQATVQSGGILNYEISLANNVGLSSYKLQVLYDTTALDINAVKSGRLFGDFTVDYTKIDGGIEITGTSEGLNKQNGSFLTLEFTAAEGIENATYPISIACTENGNDATIECEEGSVAISGYVLGDINGDGRVNNFDVMMHVGYLSGGQKLTPEQLMAADVTGDGNVDYLDYSSISSYVVGIYEGLNSDVETMGSSLSYASNFVGGANSERAVITASEIFDAQPGEYVTVDVDISRNPGLSGYVVTMEYDTESLELIDIVQKYALSGGKFNTNTSVEGEATVMWSDNETHNENGTIFSVTFKLGNTVPEESPLILTYNSEHTGYLDETYTSVPVTLMSEDGAIYIDTESAYMTLDNIINDGTNISGSVNIYNDAEFEGTTDLFIATYDGLGKLVSIESQDVELKANETATPDISISAKDAKTLKVFVFEKGSIRPLMKSKSKTF